MNIIAWNDAYCALNGNLTVMSERERNLVWMTFTSPLSAMSRETNGKCMLGESGALGS
ncbi:hypothetical protein [Paenibacillus sp. VCA1]|uniref:MmyB family transcriptional regulator n=1 Tax=Paenibacillus sp. VCA1 TaxID=3039148 RepID=UPI0037CA72FF